MDFFKKNWLFILVILLLAIIPVANTGLIGLIDKTDFNFPFFPIETFQRYLHIWDSAYLGSDQSILQTPKLPLFGLWALLNACGLSADIINRLTFVGIFFLLGFGSYYLIWVLIKGRSRLACFIGSLFFMFNPLITLHLLNAQMDILMVIGLIPLVLALYVKGLESQNKVYLIFIIFLSIFIFSTNLTVSGLFLILMFLFGLYCLIIYSAQAKQILIYTLLMFAGILLINCYWLLPFIYKTFIIKESIYTPSDYFQFLVNQFNQIGNVVRLVSFNLSTTNYPFMKFYQSAIFIFTSWLIVAIIACNLFFKKSRLEVFLFILAIIFIFFAAGTNPPFGKIYGWLWDHLPGFNLYRGPTKWAILFMLIYSVLIGLIVYRISDSSKKIIFYPFALLFILVILVNGTPILSGNLKGWLVPISVPENYYQFKDWLANQSGDFKTWIMPRQNWYIKYNWSKYDLTDIINFLTPKPIIEEFSVGAPAAKTSQFIEKINDVIDQDNLNKLGHLLAISGTKYIFLRNDGGSFDQETNESQVIKNTFIIPKSWEKVKSLLDKSKDISLAKKFGLFDIYKINGSLVHNEIYTPQTAYYFDGQVENLSSLVSLKEYQPDSGIFLAEQNQGSEIIPLTNQKIIARNIQQFSLGNKQLINWIKIPQEGNYQIAVKANKDSGSTPQIAIDGQTFSLNDKQSNDWVSIGTKFFNQKKYQLSIKGIFDSVSLKNPSFESGPWEIINASENSPGQSEFQALQNINATEGDYSIELYSKQQILGMRQKVKQLSPNALYHLSFDYKNIDGTGPLFIVESLKDNGQTNGIFQTETLKQSSDWQREDFVFQPVTDSAYIYFYARPRNFQSSANLYDNVELEKINPSVSEIALIGTAEGVQIPPGISYQKISPTKIKVSVVDAQMPYFINFLNSYNSGWQARIIFPEGQTVKVSPKNHFMVNGFANSWYIDETGTYQIVIEYWPQKLFFIGIIIMLLTFISCVGYLIWRYCSVKRSLKANLL